MVLISQPRFSEKIRIFIRVLVQSLFTFMVALFFILNEIFLQFIYFYNIINCIYSFKN